MRLKGRSIYPGLAQGIALVSQMGISFFGGVDPESARILEKGHDLEGCCIAGMVLVFPTGKGSTVGSYTLYRLKQNGLAPLAIINRECETITAIGCIISEIPCVDHIAIDKLKTGDRLIVEGDKGAVQVLE